MLLFIIEFVALPGFNQSPPLVEIGCSNRAADAVVAEANKLIEASESGVRDLVPLHRRKAKVWHTETIQSEDLARRFVSKAIDALDARFEGLTDALPNIYKADVNDALSTIEEVKKLAAAAKKRSVTMAAKKAAEAANVKAEEKAYWRKMKPTIERIESELKGLYKRDPRPPLICKVLDGSYGAPMASYCQGLLSGLPTREGMRVECDDCGLEFNEYYSVERGWYYEELPVPLGNGFICAACSKRRNDAEFTNCASCGEEFQIDDPEETYDDPDGRVCASCNFHRYA